MEDGAIKGKDAFPAEAEGSIAPEPTPTTAQLAAALPQVQL
jgi:hypothetical protein